MAEKFHTRIIPVFQPASEITSQFVARNEKNILRITKTTRRLTTLSLIFLHKKGLSIFAVYTVLLHTCNIRNVTEKSLLFALSAEAVIGFWLRAKIEASTIVQVNDSFHQNGFLAQKQSKYVRFRRS